MLKIILNNFIVMVIVAAIGYVALFTNNLVFDVLFAIITVMFLLMVIGVNKISKMPLDELLGVITVARRFEGKYSKLGVYIMLFMTAFIATMAAIGGSYFYALWWAIVGVFGAPGLQVVLQRVTAAIEDGDERIRYK